MKKKLDKNGRVLKDKERQLPNGQYCYTYTASDGKRKTLYSWRLTATDKIPKGKRSVKPLREKIEDLTRDKLNGLDTSGRKLTLCQLYEKQNALKPNVRKSTVESRKRLMNILKADNLGNTDIKKIRPSDAKAWAVRMSSKGIAYNTIKNDKRSLKACFYTAMEDDLVHKNPFNWNLDDVIKNDTVPKTALTEEQATAFLDFIKEDKVYKRHYGAVAVLLHTGIRISELCGLTVSDIDFENSYINVTHQLLRDKDGYYITPPKTESGVRQVALKAVREELQKVIEDRRDIQPITVDGYSDFIFLNKKGLPMYGEAYSTVFSAIVRKYNKNHEEKLPNITPHVLRHTFCTNMANKNMPVKALQYIMGHKDVTLSLGYYAHGSAEFAKAEMERIGV